MAETEVLVAPVAEETETVVEEAVIEATDTDPQEEQYVNHNKRKFEDAVDGEEDEDAHIRKRGSAPTLDDDTAVVSLCPPPRRCDRPDCWPRPCWLRSCHTGRKL